MGHQFAHRRLEVVVAHDTAGDPGRARSDSALVKDHDVVAAAQAPGPEFPGKMPCGGEPMDSGTDDDVATAGRDGSHSDRLSLATTRIARHRAIRLTERLRTLGGSFPGRRTGTGQPGRGSACGAHLAFRPRRPCRWLSTPSPSGIARCSCEEWVTWSRW